MEDARAAGKTRFISYSGDEEAAAWAVEKRSYSPRCRRPSTSLTRTRAAAFWMTLSNAGMGIIIKRPIANGIWGGEPGPGPRATLRFDDIRSRVVAAMTNEGPVPGAPADRILLALGFTFAHPQVDTAIVGTRNPDHLLSNIELVNSGLGLADGVVEELYRRFDLLGADWRQIS